MKEWKTKNLILIVMIFFLIMPIYQYFKNVNNRIILKSSQTKLSNNSLSLMYETTIGSGEYVVVNNTSWPGEEYSFNGIKSKCENGGELVWDEDAKIVSLKANTSDRCYVYFDKKITLANVCQGQNMASCIIANYELDNSIIYHNGTVIDATYGVVDAEDKSYRYSGANEEVNNFVCFGNDTTTCPNDNLYRIIGVFNEMNTETGGQEARVKLIKYDYALTNLLGTDGEYNNVYSGGTSYYKGTTDVTTIPGYHFNGINGTSSTNDWTISRLNTVNLNTNYLKNIGTTWAEKIANSTWKIGGMTSANGYRSVNIAKTAYTNEVGSSSVDKTYPAKIGLIYISDYYYASDSTYWTYIGWNDDETKDYRVATGSNWMYMGLYEWSITSRIGNSNTVFHVNDDGRGNDGYVYSAVIGVRPCFYLNASTKLLSGSGTMTDPYRIA